MHVLLYFAATNVRKCSGFVFRLSKNIPGFPRHTALTETDEEGHHAPQVLLSVCLRHPGCITVTDSHLSNRFTVGHMSPGTG